jgi:mannose-1-phosphate guanylyltransferase
MAVLAGGNGQRLSALTHKCDPEAGVIFIPSDHYVEHEDLLAEFLRQATAPEALDSDKLTLLGMTPNAPDSGFGYLSPAPDSGVGLRPVHKFSDRSHAARPHSGELEDWLACSRTN